MPFSWDSVAFRREASLILRWCFPFALRGDVNREAKGMNRCRRFRCPRHPHHSSILHLLGKQAPNMSEDRRSSVESSPVPGHSFGGYIHGQEVGGRMSGRIYGKMVYCHNVGDYRLSNRTYSPCGISDARSHGIYRPF